jgi:hypothetical protein
MGIMYVRHTWIAAGHQPNRNNTHVNPETTMTRGFGDYDKRGWRWRESKRETKPSLLSLRLA